MNTKIIATIGPSSMNEEVLSFFRQNSVEYARLNFSHGSSDSHREAALLCKKAGLKVMFDLSGPKTRLGILAHTIRVTKGSSVILEKVENEQVYPYPSYNQGAEVMVLPCQFEITKFATTNSSLYIDDGKIKLKVLKIEDHRVHCEVINGGDVVSNKGVNIPGCDPDIQFLTDRDRHLLADLLADIQPEMVSMSFVRYAKDILTIKGFIDELVEAHSLGDYYPLLCSKIEQQQAVQGDNFKQILELSDVIMVARGDLGLETEPVHIMVPFYQDKIVELCKSNQVPVIVATQILESMITSQVPTRSEVSDLYRAVVINEADYVMLSAESAVGQFAKEAVGIMHSMCSSNQDYKSIVKQSFGTTTPVKITYNQV